MGRDTENCKKNYSQNCWYFLMLIKEILDVQNGMFHVLTLVWFLPYTGTQKGEEERCAHTRMHTCSLISS